ncbi:MAG: prepilin-type N-terminal cleavage/methylation domain-containing protein [Phycisphaerales bacterium]|nr:prepilin-type N-terminal cleavage/methylation domain-containing protein [Phycisphaerales bacterium]
MHRRGLTILEVIVAMAILMALMALAAPNLAGRLSGARGEAVSRDLVSAVALARTDARRDARSIRLVLIPTDPGADRPLPPRLIARAFETSRPAGRASEGGAPGAMPDSAAPLFDAFAIDDPADDVVLLELPRGATVARRPPTHLFDPFTGQALALPPGVSQEEFAAASDASVSGAGGLAFDGGWNDAGAPGEVSLGVLLPGGAAVSGAPVYLTLPGPAVLELTLDGWTGVLNVARWRPPLQDDPDDPFGDELEGEPVEASDAARRAPFASDPGARP